MFNKFLSFITVIIVSAFSLSAKAEVERHWIIPYYTENGQSHFLLSSPVDEYWPPFVTWLNNTSTSQQKAQEIERLLQGYVTLKTNLQKTGFFDPMFYRFAGFTPNAFPGPWTRPKKILPEGMCGMAMHDGIASYPVYFVPVHKPADTSTAIKGNVYDLENRWVSDKIIKNNPEGKALRQKLTNIYENAESDL